MCFIFRCRGERASVDRVPDGPTVMDHRPSGRTNRGDVGWANRGDVSRTHHANGRSPYRYPDRAHTHANHCG